MSAKELGKKCMELQIDHHGPRIDLLYELMKYYVTNNYCVIDIGFLEMSNGFGFIRDMKNDFLPSKCDIYVSMKTIKELDLRVGDQIEFVIAPPKLSDKKFFSLHSVLSVNGEKNWKKRIHFQDLKAIYPKEQIKFESQEERNNLNTISRFIDLIIPIGFGQRALVVAPPKTGKTTVMYSIASSLVKNHPKVKLIILLVGERPEEVDEMEKIVPDIEIISSTFDESYENQIKTAEMVSERTKRLVELGFKVVLLMDSITRLVRAYNAVQPSSGKILTGGLDPAAIQKPKKFLGSARNTYEGGSLTIIATCLTETGSRMDDFVYEEFKGTGNCEIKLDRRMAEQIIFPAVDIRSSGTRRVELMIDEKVQSKRVMLEMFLSNMDYLESTKFLVNKIIDTTSNSAILNFGIK